MNDITSLIARTVANSFTPAAIQNVSPGLLLLRGSIAVVLGNELPKNTPLPSDIKKVVWFGTPPEDTGFPGLRREASLPSLHGTDTCPGCRTPKDHHTESSGYVRYTTHSLTETVSEILSERPFTRFDFMEEWNNLGFGRIRTDGSIWAVQGGIIPVQARELAGLFVRTENSTAQYAGSYLTLYDTPERSVLWCDRPVGPVDSTEWTIIERFLCDWRADTLPCLPCLQGTPAGCSALATMRLDCDEDISSARDVFEWYQDQHLPFSLAVKTCLPMTEENLALLRDVNAAGGTLLSHSHTHPFDWGGSFEAAKVEGEASRQWFRDNLPEAPVPDLAVSPFHTNPPCAMQAVESAGFTGVVSGIIHNDPEYMLGRAGVAPFTRRLVTISQQSMLHGDCYAQQKESVAVHVTALDLQRAARGIFGYLDHPFSERYQYGWESKEQRLGAHHKLVEAIRARPDVWFWNQRQCFDFVKALMRVTLVTDDTGSVTVRGAEPSEAFRMEYRYRGALFTI